MRAIMDDLSATAARKQSSGPGARRFLVEFQKDTEEMITII